VRSCHYCGPTEKELRPYGPDGSDICYSCMKESPEREQEASQRYGALLEANAVIGDDIVTIGSEDGPQPGVQL
jgi:hypothetical protein